MIRTQFVLPAAFVLLLSAPLISQQTPASSPASPALTVGTDSITVTTTVEPLPFAESDRSVLTISPAAQPAGSFDTAVDLLRTDPSVNIQARAAEGVQADLAIRGTTFEQSLVLVNGLRVNDPETGHLNLDIPVPLDAITSIDILHGSGSTLYGSDAIGGAVNLVTSEPAHGTNSAPAFALTARTGGGSYGSLENHLRASVATKFFSEQLTASRDTSDGFAFDRNYSSNAASSESWLHSAAGTTDILLAASDRPYGANNFYGNYPEWERTKAWLASIQQQLGSRTAASFGYLKHTDEFVLILGQPQIYENNHTTTSYEAALRRADPIGRNATLSYGLEEAGDTIHSSSLGVHARNQGAGYANLSLRSLKRLSLSLGAREEILSSHGSVFSPNVAGAVTLSSSLRVRAAASHGFRQPTYVDLYYADPATNGNPLLKPESSWSYEGGVDYSPSGGRITLSAAGFRLNQTNAIDYVKRVPTDKWQAVNIPTLDLSGAEVSARIRLTDNQQLTLAYTAAHSANLPPELISEYAFNYAAQNAVFSWTADQLPTQLFGAAGKQITLRTQVNIVQKTTHTAYPLWDVNLTRSTGTIRPYVRLLNLANTGYTELPGIPMQGRTILGGVEISWIKR
ncbi:MAG TPA: TonB-dependent receptor [Acidobacteriaceae bacterium]|nr:TonB-dependent receptor [Acidobacteriaceae bacterium]